MGLATYPDDADNCKELIEQADIALYQAKKSGKNMVCNSMGCVSRYGKLPVRPNIKIMVIDNEEIIRCLLDEVLSGEGFEVALFDCGEKAVAEALTTFFDITITDLHMPGMDGVETIKAIREINPHTVFLMVASYPDKLLEITQTEKDVLCLQKPFGIDELRQMVNHIIQDRLSIQR